MTGLLVLGVFMALAFLSVPILTSIIIASAAGVVAGSPIAWALFPSKC